MAMQWLESELKKTGDSHDAHYAAIIAHLRHLRGRDIVPPVSYRSPSKHLRWLDHMEKFITIAPARKRSQEEQLHLIYIQAVKEYLSSDHSPESLTKLWNKKLRASAAITGIPVTILPCDRTFAEIQEIDQQDRTLIYVPPEAYLPHDVPESEKEQGDELFTDSVRLHGWLDVDSQTNPLYTNTTEEELRTVLSTQDRASINEVVYAIASHFSAWTTGIYFDSEGTYTRLIDTRNGEGKALAISQTKSGEYNWFGCDRDYRAENLGGRSVGFKKS